MSKIAWRARSTILKGARSPDLGKLRSSAATSHIV
jgi:hypothetical protein